jgi:hypothetical protein
MWAALSRLWVVQNEENAIKLNRRFAMVYAHAKPFDIMEGDL